MKIQRIKLKNFIGIDHGIGLNEVELNFNSQDNMILFKADNGRGKTTLLSLLQPFKQTLDQRKYIVLPHKEGLKEITLTDDEDVYEIRHIYTPNKDGKHSSSSFITKNGEELNSSGLNSTFEQVIKKEFGITQDYLKISKICSNTKSFTKQTTAERKVFIGTFLNMEELTLKYKVVDAKIKAMKKDIGVLETNMDQYQNIETLNNLIQELSNYITNANIELKDLYSKKGSLETTLASIQSEKLKYNKNDIVYELSKLNDLLNGYKNEVKLVKATISEDISIDVLKNILADTQKVHDDAKAQHNEYKIKLESKKEEKTKAEIELEKIKKEIDNAKGNVDISDLETNLNTYTKNLSDISIQSDLRLLELQNVSSDLDRIEILASAIQSKLPKMLNNSFVTLSEILDNTLSEKLINGKQKNNSQITEYKNKTNELNNKINNITMNAKRTASLLDSRPSNCNIDTCPFIAEALINQQALVEIDNLTAELDRDQKLLEAKEKINEQIDEIVILQSEFNSIYSIVKNTDTFKFWNSIYDINDITSENTQSYFNNFVNFKNITKEDLESYKMKKYYESKISDTTQLIEHEKEKIKLVEDKYMKDYNRLTEQVNEMTEVYDSLMEDFSVAYAVISETYPKTLSLVKAIEGLTHREELIGQRTDYQSKLETLEGLETKDIEYVRDIEINSNKINMLESGISVRSKELQEAQMQLKTVEELSSKLSVLNEKYIPMTQIHDALSPTKGIPLVLMRAYLSNTEIVANELLAIAFGDKFRIKFVTNEKEFMIQVIKDDGSIKEDIALASQGEQSIIETAISLALISQMVSKFNIISLDEADASLDANNRKLFVDILKLQLEKLGCEQCFIISHNTEFDSDDLAKIVMDVGICEYIPTNK